MENAMFVRHGVMHRNTFINAPKLLLQTAQMLDKPQIFVAGQLSGVEGYVESAASGLLAGINASRLYQRKSTVIAPRETAIGSLLYYITHTDTKSFQPMNITFGLMPPWPEKIKDKRKKKILIAERAIEAIEDFILREELSNN
jgi:methylenetetrahydrofolate--tRNA-(uracil-5-)-methyltransferase